MTLSIAEVSILDIQLPEKLLKAHPLRQIEQIANSIKAFGFNDPVAVDENGEIIEGTGRYLAAQQLGLEIIPVIRLSNLNPAQKKAYRIAHNKIAANSDFDLDALRQEFESLCQLDSSLLSLTGFQQIEVDDLLKIPEVPQLAHELTESLSSLQKVTCPHCGGLINV